MHRDESLAQVACLLVSPADLVARYFSGDNAVLFRTPLGIPIRVQSPPRHASPDPFLFH
jgi:hypothetical protein